MRKTKFNSQRAFLIGSCLIMIVLATIGTVNSVFADHGLDTGECAVEYGTSDPRFDLCTQHARVDRDIVDCQQAGGTPDAIDRCIDNINAASDGYPHGSDESSTGQSTELDGFDDSFSNPDNLCNNLATGEPDPNCNLTDCNGVLISIDVECVEADNPILSYLGAIVNFLAAGVGLIVTAVIVVAGLQYIFAKGNPQQVEQARNRILQAIIALTVFIFLYAFLQWLIPGGLF